MLRRFSVLLRPFGVAFGIFIVLNLALALQRAELSVTSIWLDADLPEPALSLYAGILGVCLFIPHHMVRASWVRWITGGVFAGFAVLALVATAAFYHAVYSGRIATDLPVPLSALVFLILSSEFIRVGWWQPWQSSIPPPAQFFLFGISVAGAFLFITVVHVVTYGHRDFRRNAEAAVIFGAKVYSDGRPCDALMERLDTGIEVYRQGLVRYLILTGARDPNGQSEPLVMRKYILERGIPLSRIIVDETGLNTRASALSCRAIARKRNFGSLLAVTQYFHCARVKMIFEREGVNCATVPTCSSRKATAGEGVRLSREGFFLLREAIAFPFYLIYYR